MSGHSKWATIHRQKEIKDAKKGNLFSKFAKAISVAVKTGGGPNIDSNFKLKEVVEKARSVNMPKDNIERAVLSAVKSSEMVEEVVYEGFGPYGVSVIVEAATDNKNRTAQEIKNLFERAGGSLAGPGSVSFNFVSKGFILVEKSQNREEDILKLIDLGAEDVEESEDGIEVYTAPDKLRNLRNTIESSGFKVKSSEITMRPVNLISVNEKDKVDKVLFFLDSIEEHDDVQKVYANLDVPEGLV